jgi:hypothetical protein
LAAACVLMTLAGAACGGESGSSASVRTSMPPTVLDLRAVASSHPGNCAASPLTGASGGSACALDGRTSYALGTSLGQVTVSAASIVIDPVRNARGLDVSVTAADVKTLGDVSTGLVNKRLAVLWSGRVVMAATVQAPIEDGQIQVFGLSPVALDQLAAAFRADVPSPAATTIDDSGSGPSAADEAAQRKVCTPAGRKLVPTMSYNPMIVGLPLAPAQAASMAAGAGDERGQQLWLSQPPSDRVYLCNYAAPAPAGYVPPTPSCPPGQDPMISDGGTTRAFLVDVHGHASEVKNPVPPVPPCMSSDGH